MSSDALITLFMIVYCANIVALMFLLWLMLCNHRTCEQRRKLIPVAFGYGADPRFMESYHRVSYHKHIWTMAFLLNWKKLYHPDLIKAAGY